MRVLILLLLIPSAGWTQARPEPEVTSEPAAVQAQAAQPDTVRSGSAMQPVSTVAAAAERKRDAAAAEVAQPTMRNFLYQILLTAVTALITALIWKAVF